VDDPNIDEDGKRNLTTQNIEVDQMSVIIHFIKAGKQPLLPKIFPSDLLYWTE
jgi:hypothetical protein